MNSILLPEDVEGTASLSPGAQKPLNLLSNDKRHERHAATVRTKL